MNILVTGGAGFIGSHVAENLVKDHRVIVLDDLSGGFAINVPNGATFVKGSINDVDLVDALFDLWGFDYVYHFAAYAAEGLSPFIRRFNYENNLIGSVNLINASIRNHVKCFVFTSSIAVYGNSPMIETVPPSPIDPYGISKLAVEMDLKAAHEQFGLNYIIFRPHNVYGPRQNLMDKYRNVIGIFMRNKLNDEPATVFGDGEQRRAFTNIGDISNILAQSAFKSKFYNQVFNIGSSTTYSINQLLQYIGIKEVNYEPARHEVEITEPDHSKLDKISPALDTNLETGIASMWEWAKNEYPNGVLQPAKFTNIEITRNLPESWTR